MQITETMEAISLPNHLNPWGTMQHDASLCFEILLMRFPGCWWSSGWIFSRIQWLAMLPVADRKHPLLCNPFLWLSWSKRKSHKQNHTQTVDKQTHKDRKITLALCLNCAHLLSLPPPILFLSHRCTPEDRSHHTYLHSSENCLV